ncbi:hypothetical protein ACFQ08_25260 [Streptosporangium algeriense]|uniref:Transposase n=1 Tax=Streptosporangium algeriense TaxID=1682748 RepID=A0ABW3DVM5_9ACTN
MRTPGGPTATILARFRDAEHAYNAARRTSDRYAPGPQKDRAGAALNTTADQLAAVEAELTALDQHRLI